MQQIVKRQHYMWNESVKYKLQTSIKCTLCRTSNAVNVINFISLSFMYSRRGCLVDGNSGEPPGGAVCIDPNKFDCVITENIERLLC